MNVIDATVRTDDLHSQLEPASLLTIILDTNPHAWALLVNSLSLSKLVANLLVFINAHIAINHSNRVSVIASHAEIAEFLYPTPEKEASNDHPDDANKYRPFAHIEHALSANLRRLMADTTAGALSATPATMMAGALTMALTYISKQSASFPTANTSTQFNYSDANFVAGGNDLSTDGPKANGLVGSTSRILILSVSGDLANQYIPIMNSIFACQRLNIPIDILKLAGDSVFLQQAADATGGTFMALDETSRSGLLQYLMFVYLPDQTARDHLIVPGEGEGVDFRAACFCHRRVVDIGFVCSVCLSIFCEPLDGSTCLTCSSHLSIANYSQKPVVIPKKKKKRRRPLEGSFTPDSRASTPL